MKTLNKHNLLIFTFCLSFFVSYGQSDKPRYEAHWAGIDIGMNMLMNDEMSTDFTNHQYWENNIIQSTSIHLNILEYKIPIFKQYLGLTTGFGWHINSYSFKDNYVLFSNDSIVSASMDEQQEYDQNYLTVHYLSVPLLLDFSTKVKGKNSFYLCAGVVGSVRVGSKTTLKGDYANGDKFKNTRRSKFNLNPIAVDATVRAGYNGIGIFASYGLTPLFQKDKTVAIYPLRFGLTLNIPTIGKDKSESSLEDFEEEMLEEL